MIKVFLVQDGDSVVCVNVDNDEGAVTLIEGGARELSGEEVAGIFGGAAHMAGGPGTVVEGTDVATASVTWTAPDVDLEALAVLVRAERDARIQAVAWRFERHASEARLGLAPTDDIAALDAYAQALRDVPGQPGFPETINWPVEPE